MSIFDYFTTCKKPFNDGIEWQLAVAPSAMPGFRWLDASEVRLGWTAGACSDWLARMWAIEANGQVAHSGQFYRHPQTNETFWTYYGAPEGSKVNDPPAMPYVATAQAAGFVFAEAGQPEPGPEDEEEPKPEKKAGIPWWGVVLGVGALVTVIVAKTRKTKRKKGYERKA